jgi:hypothetical protein
LPGYIKYSINKQSKTKNGAKPVSKAWRKILKRNNNKKEKQWKGRKKEIKASTDDGAFRKNFFIRSEIRTPRLTNTPSSLPPSPSPPIFPPLLPLASRAH